MSRLFLVYKQPNEHFRPYMEPREVLAYDKDAHRLEFRRPDGTLGVSTNFHIYMAKRCGYSLTAEVPPEFKRG